MDFIAGFVELRCGGNGGSEGAAYGVGVQWECEAVGEGEGSEGEGGEARAREGSDDGVEDKRGRRGRVE